MIPQVMVFAFLFLTSLVAISKDLQHQNLTLATAWNVTNTIVIGVFIAAAFRESRRAKAAERRPVVAAPALPASFGSDSQPATRRARRATDVTTTRSRPTPTPELISLNERRTS